MAKGKGNALANAKARVAKLEAADKRKKAIVSANAELNRAKAKLKAARGGSAKKKA